MTFPTLPSCLGNRWPIRFGRASGAGLNGGRSGGSWSWSCNEGWCEACLRALKQEDKYRQFILHFNNMLHQNLSHGSLKELDTPVLL